MDKFIYAVSKANRNSYEYSILTSKFFSSLDGALNYLNSLLTTLQYKVFIRFHDKIYSEISILPTNWKEYFAEEDSIIEFGYYDEKYHNFEEDLLISTYKLEE